MICMIGLLREGNVFDVSPVHSEILILTDGIFTWAKGAKNFGINN